jgi:hypothetical protein
VLLSDDSRVEHNVGGSAEQLSQTSVHLGAQSESDVCAGHAGPGSRRWTKGRNFFWRRPHLDMEGLSHSGRALNLAVVRDTTATEVDGFVADTVF